MKDNRTKNYEQTDDLIMDCKLGVRNAQEFLYKKFYHVLMGIVRRYIDNADEAEEVLHNGFLKIFKNIHSFENRGSFEGWMKRITFHCVSDFVRSNKARWEAELNVEIEVKSAEVMIYDKMDYNQSLKLLNKLPEMQKIVFNMFVIDGYSHTEIAEILHIPSSTSKWYLAEAKKKLKMFFERRN